MARYVFVSALPRQKEDCTEATRVLVQEGEDKSATRVLVYTDKQMEGIAASLVEGWVLFLFRETIVDGIKSSGRHEIYFGNAREYFSHRGIDCCVT